MTVDIAMLSEAQKRWILAARPSERLGGALATYPPSQTRKVLHRLGLWFWCGMLTGKGLEARALLLKDNSDAG